jgi:hypothetical protein
MIILGQPLLADPNSPHKVRDGRLDEIVKCNRENHCLHRTMLNLPVQCSLNPALGNESHGQATPIKRLLSASREQAVLKLSGSGPFMGLVTMAMGYGKRK